MAIEAIEDESIDLGRYVGVILSRWWLMLLLPLIGGLVGYYYSSTQEVYYQARATLLVQQNYSGGFSPGVNDFVVSQQLASTYSRLIKTSPFLERVIENRDLSLSAGSLSSMISAGTGSNPPVVEILVSHGTSEVAANTASLVAQEFIDYVVEQRLAEIARLQSAAAAQGIINAQDFVTAQLSAIDSLSLLEPVISASAVVPATSQNIMFGLLGGLLLATLIAFLLESMGDTVRFPDEVSKRFGVTLLGTVFRWSQQDADADELVLWKAPTSNYAESFRQIRANIQFATVNQPGKVYLVCSPGPGEGKSTITCNMSIALAQMGKRVVIIDGDLRRATIHKRFQDVKREPGLSNYLADITTDFNSIVHPTEIEGVSVIPSGPTPPNPAELLGSPKMAILLKELENYYDYIIVDSPPILVVADGSILASQVDGAIIVADGTSTRSSALHASLNTLKNTRVNILGVIINKMKRARFGYGYSYYYYYSYRGYYGTDESTNGSVNGNGHDRRFYQRPAHWVKSVVSRGPKA